tara:strand:+ start:1849 stop:2049 length:201 start_codon:yes stop_codon:yes gene_type:complete
VPEGFTLKSRRFHGSSIIKKFKEINITNTARRWIFENSNFETKVKAKKSKPYPIIFSSKLFSNLIS